MRKINFFQSHILIVRPQLCTQIDNIFHLL